MPIYSPQELIVIGLLLLGTAFWLWVLVDCARREEGSTRVAWMLVIALGHVIGAFLYIYARRLFRSSP